MDVLTLQHGSGIALLLGHIRRLLRLGQGSAGSYQDFRLGIVMSTGLLSPSNQLSTKLFVVGHDGSLDALSCSSTDHRHSPLR